MRSLFSFTVIFISLHGSFLPVQASLSQANKTKPVQIVQLQSNCNHPTSTVESVYCSRIRYEAADQQLNQVYQQLISKLNDEERSLLTEAQLGWIQLRDNNCEFAVYPSRRGTGYRGFLNDCKERMTKERTTELEKYSNERFIRDR